jgi:glutathione S-transferase
VAIILKELDLPYETEYVDFAKIKEEPYTKVNPNGRVPAITDPNTGITLWESAAIIEYLVDQYDKEGVLTYRKAPEKYYIQQFLHFQMSGESYSRIFRSS